jgi:regulator of protease activity HflC (stomatin/prohibitin superfamily)
MTEDSPRSRKNRWVHFDDKGHEKMDMLRIIKDAGLFLVVVILVLPALSSSFYTVNEGHVGITKRFNAATGQVDPGLHFKIPFIDTVEEMEVRTRKNVEEAASATSEQMPITAQVSINWTVTRSAALDLFVNYGGLDQFEARMLDPRLRQAAKAILSKFTAEQLIQNREQARSEIQEMFTNLVETLPISVDSAQIENIELPAKYLASIEAKQTEKNLAAAEKFKLERQNLEAQQLVQTANANRDATKAKADGEAYAIEQTARAEAEALALKGLAEAKAIEAKGNALKDNPLIVALTHEQQWNGQLPTTVMGEGTNILWQRKE